MSEKTNLFEYFQTEGAENVMKSLLFNGRVASEEDEVSESTFLRSVANITCDDGDLHV